MTFKERASQDLKEVKEILDKFNITFFLTFGTCLGAVRDGDFIEHDYDIDIGSLDVVPDDVRFKLTEALLEKTFYTQWNCDFCKIYRGKIDPVLPIDLFFMREEGDKFFAYRNYQKWKTIDKRYFSHFKEVDFNGDKYLVPDPPEEYLTFQYKDWKTPVVKEPVYYRHP